jgi:hypothetical protein
VVTHAKHVRETIAMLDQKAPEPVRATAPPPAVGVQPDSAKPAASAGGSRR